MSSRKPLQQLILFSCWLILSTFCRAASPHSPAVIIIIDDLGNDMTLGQRALALPGKLNFAFLPHLGASKRLAEAAHQRGHDILLHAPMSSVKALPLGPGALTEQMDQQQFTLALRQALDSIPHVRGVNNHMGSLLTQQPQPMAWLMTELKRRQLYFIDSRTTTLTVAAQQAEAHRVPHLQRKVFLDNERDIAAIERQFEKLLTQARRNGYAVAIGHPYPQTLAVLQRQLPTLARRGFQSLRVSEALQLAARAKPQQRH